MHLIQASAEDVGEKSVELDYIYNPRLNYAAQQNSVPMLRFLELRNPSESTLRNLRVEITLEPDATVEPFVLRLDALEPGAIFRRDVLDPKLSLAKLSRQTERERGYVHASVFEGDTMLLKRSDEIEILAYNEWGGTVIAPELLAAFSQPNNPALGPLVTDAQERLRTWSGYSALSGYQSKSRERARLTAAAFYAAVQARRLTYIGMPPSFESDGQKIRTPEQLLSEGRGNCLDLTMLIAACLEYAGLHPIVLLTDGHAFPGVWLEKESFDTLIVDDPLAIKKRVEVGSICIFDSSIMTNQPPAEFQTAERVALEHLNEEFQFVIDVHCARGHRILPLPSRNSDAEFVVETAEPTASVTSAPTSYPALAFTDDQVKKTAPVKEPAERRLQRWKEKLLDLSMRNRLLNFRPSPQTLPLQVVDIAQLEDVLAGGKRLRLFPRLEAQERARDSELHKDRVGADLLQEKLAEALARKRLHTSLTPEELDKRLLKIWREARTVQEETGTSTLFLALGFLEWYESPSSDAPKRAPILLLPIELTRGQASEGFKVALTDDEARLNVTLLEKLRVDFNLTIGGLNELPEDASGLDIPRILHTVRRQIVNMPRWQVVEEASIGPFSFTKFLLWLDLEARSETLKKNEVVARLMDAGREPFLPAEFPSSETIDTVKKTEECLCPLDADSSQLAAIFASEGRASFVLQGPPGTGKSQTITNIIAHTLGLGKTVLFVAEKLAALSVVKQRLDKVGLGPFCLELHSNKARKADVIRQLGEALAVSKDPPPSGWQERLGELEALKGRLNEYAAKLNEVHPIGMSVFDITSKLIGLREAPLVTYDPPTELTATRLKETLERVVSWHREAAEVGEVHKHPLREWHTPDWSPIREDGLANSLRSACETMQMLQQSWLALKSKLDLDGWQATFDDVASLAQVGETFVQSAGAPPKLLVDNGWKLARQTVDTWATRVEEHNSLEADLGALFHLDRLKTLPLDTLISTFEKAETSPGWVAWFQTFSSRRQLGKVARAALPSRADTLTSARQAKRWLELASTLEELRPQAEEWLGLLWKGKDTDLTVLQTHLTWIESFRKQLLWLEDRLGPEGEKARTQVARWSEEPESRADLFRSLSYAYQRYQSAQSELLEKAVASVPGPKESLEDVQGRLTRWADGLRQMREWSAFVAARCEVETKGLRALVEAHCRGEVKSDQLCIVAERAMFEWWHRQKMEQDATLRQFRGATHEQTIERFRRVDEDSLQLVRSILRARLSGRIPTAGASVSASSEFGILQRELKKKTRHLPCRQLFAQLPNLLPVLKPCVMMSPLSVAQYLDPERTDFDLVVFDEASQITVWDAIGSLARGQKAIVVGDSRQLPPTNFFGTADRDDGEADEHGVEDLESILEEAVACGMPEHKLKWHYRSRHESLITFSNVQYYEGNLLTFPSSVDHHPSFGVTLHQVDGVYDRGASRTNRAEADAIVKAIVERLQDPERRGQSVGVVTFNSQQQTLIEDLLDSARSKCREIEPYFGKAVAEPVFVKNLENVQGDERDVIFFSPTFGLDAAGKITMSFGAINKSGGERRLNVAITRARESLEVYASLRPEQIDLNRTRALGARHLREFLDYARRGPAALMSTGVVNARAKMESPFEEQVAAALQGLGWTIHAQVGSLGYRVDLGVESQEQPGTFLAGVECDGAAYHSTKCARDRDRLRETVLRQLGWNILRVWSTDWWHDPKKETARLHKALQEAELTFRSSGGSRPATTNIPVAIANEFDSIEEESPLARFSPQEMTPTGLPGTIPYTPTLPQFAPLPGAEFYEVRHHAAIRDRLLRVTAALEPVTLDHAARQVMASFGLIKLTAKAKSHILSLASTTPALMVENDVLWSSTADHHGWREVRVPDGAAASKRNIEDIPLCELVNCAELVLRQNLSLPRTDLGREMARAFGIARLGGNVQARLDTAISELLAQGRGRQDGDQVRGQ
jgi:very-short-patch-repair endonuclease